MDSRVPPWTRWLVAALGSLAACGPGSPSGDEGPSSADAGSSATEPATTSEPETDSSAQTSSGGGSSDDTGSVCTLPEELFVPGCDGPTGNDAAIEEGCYVPCSEAMPCANGLCVTAWVDPCWNSPCEACGSQQDLCLPALGTGEGCSVDAQCESGVCWNFNDYDECCFGTACTGPCETDQDCIDLATAAGGETAPMAVCGPDGRCDALSMGVGEGWACAGGMCG